MTREEAIKGLTSLLEVRRRWDDMQTMKDEIECLDMAIKALNDKDVLDKIRAEIDDEADYAYASFNEYKAYILHAESDELPDDDFRYGLRRAIEIIDKYKAESEEMRNEDSN